MSAIARFLVEFEPSPATPHGPTPALSLPASSESLGDGDAIEGFDDDVFGMASEPDTGDVEPGEGFEIASIDTALAEPSTEEAVAAAVTIAEAGFSERIASA